MLEMRNITKNFGNLTANNKIDFSLDEGEVHALLGENGAGKSTLMKILYGLLTPDLGEIYLNGEQIRVGSPTEAINYGIGMVHQHFMLVRNLTAHENIILGAEMTTGPFLSKRESLNRITELSSTFELEIPLNEISGNLSVGVQQRIEILKVLYRGARIIILDEPTAVLTPTESISLFRSFKSLIASGKSIILISHKLKEVMEETNRVTILRDGCKIGTCDTKEVSEKSLARMMVGREVNFDLGARSGISSDAQPRVSLTNVSVDPAHAVYPLNEISIDLRPGEIVGIAGVDGNGQSTVAEVLAGLCKLSSGQILLNGKDISMTSPLFRVRSGIRYIPADRIRRGSIGDLSIDLNMALRDFSESPFSESGILQIEKIRDFSKKQLDLVGTKYSTLKANVNSLSGGNLQKLIIARETAGKPAVLVAEQPTRGLDISATKQVHRELINQRDRGVAILLISADLDEVLDLSDRIITMCDGKITYEGERNQLDLEKVWMAMAGRMMHECQ